MRLLSLLSLASVLFCSSCNKDSAAKDSLAPSVTGQWAWTIECTDNPAYNSTPQSKGIAELLSFTETGSYSVTQNGIVTNSGTYRTSTAKSTSGESVPSILYTNSRVSDSAAYYTVTEGGDTLVFSNDFIGTVGSAARYYSRQ